MSPRPPDTRGADPAWFRTLADSASEVYFRYALQPTPRFEYVSPSVHALTGQTPAAFHADARVCVALFARDQRRAIAQALRARRSLSITLHLTDGRALAVRTAPVIRRTHLVAVEGVATLVAAAPHADPAVAPSVATVVAPVQQRLSALLYEVHSLLHLHPPAGAGTPAALIRLGALEFDTERLTVRESGVAVKLTSRELLVLRYLLTRPGRIVTREQLLTDVWEYSYTGDHRTVDVHISRLRRKLPSLRSRLVALKNIGYRLEEAA